ncbi:MAG: hypothetical protein AAGF12_07070 [Myxococcota bacterium]
MSVNQGTHASFVGAVHAAFQGRLEWCDGAPDDAYLHAHRTLGLPLDHLDGEEPIGWHLGGGFEDYWRRRLASYFRSGFVLTNRALHFRHRGLEPMRVRYEDIAAVREASMPSLPAKLIVSAGRELDLYSCRAGLLRSFLDSEPWTGKSGGPYRVASAPDTHESPKALAERFALRDERIERLHDLSDAFEDAAGTRRHRELLAQQTLWARTLVYGRGMKDGGLLTPLHPRELRAALELLLGPPTWFRDFGARQSMRYVFGKVGLVEKAGVLATFLASGIIGWLMLDKVGPTQVTIEVDAERYEHHTGFSLSVKKEHATGKRGEDRLLRGDLLDALAAVEGQALLLRSAYGDEPSLDELFDTTPEEVAEVLAQRGVSMDVEAFTHV